MAADDEIPKFIEPPKIDPVEAVREKLCDVDPAVRIQATLQLGEIGSLDDIGFLSDLLSLPYSLDEHPKERAALLHAMQRLSGTTTEVFDLAGMPSVIEHPEADGPGAFSTKSRKEDPWETGLYAGFLTVAAMLFLIGAVLLALVFLIP